MRIVIAVLVLASFNASAQQVYKCIGGDGIASFQSAPCRADQVAKGSYSAVIHNPTPAEMAQRQQQDAANSRYLRSIANRHRRTSGAVVVIPNEVSGCSRAKAVRDKAYDQTRKISYSAMERLAEHVNRACGY